MTAKLSTLHPDAPLDATAIAQLAAGLDPAPLSAEARATLKQRVLAQIVSPAVASQPVADPNTPGGGSVVVKANADLWVPFAPGIEIKPLRVDLTTGSQTSLWRLAAGAVLPEHDHSAEEECLIISGDMHWNGQHYGAGDFIMVRSGFQHSRMHSPSGATLLIRGEVQPCLAQVFGG